MDIISKRTVRRREGNEWCSMTVELRQAEKGVELSIVGDAGSVRKRNAAKKQAKEFWISFFEESSEEYGEFCKRFGPMTIEKAAQYILDVDGEFHGLDVSYDEGEEVFVLETCGQIRSELERFFPEAKPFFKWHLNGMNAGCEHQEALGWGRGKTIALTRDTCTDAQLAVLDELLRNKTAKARLKEYDATMNRLQESPQGREAREVFAEIVGHEPKTVHDSEQCEAMFSAKTVPSYDQALLRKKASLFVQNLVASKIPVPQFEAEIFKDSLCAPCPECGYRYGTQWLHRELPTEVIAWAKGFGKEEA